MDSGIFRLIKVEKSSYITTASYYTYYLKYDKGVYDLCYDIKNRIRKEQDLIDRNVYDECKN